MSRILKKGGINIIYEIHPFLRPFDRNLKLIKPYDAAGPFEDEDTINFHWRLQDILNAVVDSDINLIHMEELFDEKNYERPFGIKTEDIVNGAIMNKDEVDKIYDWRSNPLMGLPNWVCLVGRKN